MPFEFLSVEGTLSEKTPVKNKAGMFEAHQGSKYCWRSALQLWEDKEGVDDFRPENRRIWSFEMGDGMLKCLLDIQVKLSERVLVIWLEFR